MPGNELYRPWLMSIVADAREALEAIRDVEENGAIPWDEIREEA